MDGKSILPLVNNRHRSIKFKWPDTFLIESSGRRETPEQLAEQRAKAAAAKYGQMLSEHNNKMELTLIENKTTFEELKHDLSSHEIDEDVDEEDDEEDVDENHDDETDDGEIQKDQPKRRRHREGKFFILIEKVIFFKKNIISNSTDHHSERHHYDNNLPPYQSKLARLSVECAEPSLLQDCVPGQKWKCVYEDSRWRKHKCKFHKEVQDHLAEINKYLSAQQSRRNCACFTPNGLVYTKIKADRDVFPQKQKRFDGHRHRNGRFKRDVDFEEIFNEKLPPEFVNLLQMDEVLNNIENSIENLNEAHSRKKRETDYITQTIDELHSVLLTLENKYLNNTKGPVQCFVESSGKVNCSTIVYENEEAWRQSRIQIDMLIKVLKDKIANLKDIKKHLREHRPINMTSTDEDGVSSTEDNLESSDELDLEETSRKRQQSKQRHHGATERRKRPKSTSTSSTTTAPTEDDIISVSSTTEDDETSFNTSSTAPQGVTEATTLRQPQKTRYRTKIPKVSTTEVDDISSTSSNYELNTSESSDIVPSSESSPTSKFDEVTSESSSAGVSTIKPQLSENNNNHALNSSNTMQAECYCASKFER